MTLPRSATRIVPPARNTILAAERKRGRLILILLFGAIFLYHLWAACLSLTLQIESPLHSVVRFGFFSALMLGTYTGQNWAKWLLILIALLAGTEAVFDFAEKPSVFNGFLLFFCILPPAVLLFSKSVNSFLNR
jgi:hypothetical protein